MRSPDSEPTLAEFERHLEDAIPPRRAGPPTFARSGRPQHAW